MDKRFRPLCLPKTFVPSETLVPVPGLSGEVFNSLNDEQIVIEHRRLSPLSTRSGPIRRRVPGRRHRNHCILFTSPPRRLQVRPGSTYQQLKRSGRPGVGRERGASGVYGKPGLCHERHEMSPRESYIDRTAGRHRFPNIEMVWFERPRKLN